jgi:heptaprenyl diphosphate synthase
VILVTGAVTDPALHAEALDLLLRGPGPALARADARRYAEKAHAELAALPPLRARAVLEGLCDFVRDRSS